MSNSEIPTTYQDLITYSNANPAKLLVLKFEATWCAPCRAIKPFVDYLKTEYPNVDFHVYDIEDETTLNITEQFEIAKVPCFIYFKNGSVCDTIIGTNKENIENAINEHL